MSGRTTIADVAGGYPGLCPDLAVAIAAEDHKGASVACVDLLHQSTGHARASWLAAASEFSRLADDAARCSVCGGDIEDAEHDRCGECCTCTAGDCDVCGAYDDEPMSTMEHVLLYLQHRPATARDVAVGCFGGCGKPRTAERSKAHRTILALERQGLVRRAPNVGAGLFGRPIVYFGVRR